MDRVTKKKMPELSTETKSNLVKWVPLICAGAALGVGIIALKEIKSIQTEFRSMKVNITDSQSSNKQLEEQILYISGYIKENEKNKPSKRNEKAEKTEKTQNFEKLEKVVEKIVRPPSPVIKKELNVIEKEINIINDDEYEEVEVTDDES
jgi:hypothetical protein